MLASAFTVEVFICSKGRGQHLAALKEGCGRCLYGIPRVARAALPRVGVPATLSRSLSFEVDRRRGFAMSVVCCKGLDQLKYGRLRRISRPLRLGRASEPLIAVTSTPQPAVTSTSRAWEIRFVW